MESASRPRTLKLFIKRYAVVVAEMRALLHRGRHAFRFQHTSHTQRETIRRLVLPSGEHAPTDLQRETSSGSDHDHRTRSSEKVGIIRSTPNKFCCALDNNRFVEQRHHKTLIAIGTYRRRNWPQSEFKQNSNTSTRTHATVSQNGFVLCKSYPCRWNQECDLKD